MSKQVDTELYNKLALASAQLIIKECRTEDCEFCEELQRMLDAAKQVDDLHIESTG